MDESSNQNEICSNTLEQNVDVVIDEEQHICQSETTTQSVEDHQTNTLTTESLSLTELNIENITVINNESDDEPLLSIPPPRNNRKIRCSHNWLKKLVRPIILIFIIMTIATGILFAKYSKPSLLSTKGCNKKSETGRFFMTELIISDPSKFDFRGYKYTTEDVSNQIFFSQHFLKKTGFLYNMINDLCFQVNRVKQTI